MVNFMKNSLAQVWMVFTND